MLYEIQCDRFISNGQPRPPIRFNSGLNVVLGGRNADNSVGKSTFMLIIDFAFGGETYAKSQTALHIGSHLIKFAFKFAETLYYFSRDVVNANTVNVCDANYNVQSTLSIDNFRKKLRELYNITLRNGSFRGIVGPYFRIAEIENHNSLKPLHAFPSQKTIDAIVALEKLFDEYWHIEEYKDVLKKREEKLKAHNAARKQALLPNSVTTKTAYKRNTTEIERLEKELEELTLQTDRDLSKENTEEADQVSEIKGKITALKRKRTMLQSRLDAVKLNVSGGIRYVQGEFLELQEFFPDVNIRKIAEIEAFHEKLIAILKQQMEDEILRLSTLVAAATDEIQVLEEEQRSHGSLAAMSKAFLDKFSHYRQQIDTLRNQNKAYDDAKTFADDIKAAKQALKDAEDTILRNIESMINSQMTRYNDFVYNQTRKAPEINLFDGTRYEFTTPDDTGTGTSYKSLIVFDLSILKLTQLPTLIHDSLIFNDIGYAPLEKIMELYTQSSKQIFIAFDKKEAPTKAIQKILDSASILHLSSDGNELFGENWGRKKKDEEEDSAAPTK